MDQMGRVCFGLRGADGMCWILQRKVLHPVVKLGLKGQRETSIVLKTRIAEDVIIEAKCHTAS